MTYLQDIQSALGEIWSRVPDLVEPNLIHEFEDNLVNLLRDLEQSPLDGRYAEAVKSYIYNSYPAIYKLANIHLNLMNAGAFGRIIDILEDEYPDEYNASIEIAAPFVHESLSKTWRFLAAHHPAAYGRATEIAAPSVREVLTDTWELISSRSPQTLVLAGEAVTPAVRILLESRGGDLTPEHSYRLERAKSEALDLTSSLESVWSALEEDDPILFSNAVEVTTVNNYAILGSIQDALIDTHADTYVAAIQLVSPTDNQLVSAVNNLLETEYPKTYKLVIEAQQQTNVESHKLARLSSPARPAVGRYWRVPIWFATDRNPTRQKKARRHYGSRRSDLRFGYAEVSIPDTHTKGALETPRLYRLSFRENPERHVTILSVDESGEAEWISQLTNGLLNSSADVLLVVHGYNVGFDAAARRAAQLAYDLQFQGATVLYSWPSCGRKLKYGEDGANAEWTSANGHFLHVLKALVSKVGANHIHILAHSMGSRILLRGIKEFDWQTIPQQHGRLSQIVFAAPDVDRESFGSTISKCDGKADRITLYASAKDKALEISRKIHGYPRAGDAGPNILVDPLMETIDATDVDDSSMGHSYFCENRPVLADLFSLIAKGEGAAARRFGLRECGNAPGIYWTMIP